MISKLGYNKKEEKGKINEILITYGFWVSRKKKTNKILQSLMFHFSLKWKGMEFQETHTKKKYPNLVLSVCVHACVRL